MLASGGGGGSRSDTISGGYEQVDKSIKLSLETKGALDPLANAYVSVKNQKPEMIIVTPSTVTQNHHDREMVSDY